MRKIVSKILILSILLSICCTYSEKNANAYELNTNLILNSTFDENVKYWGSLSTEGGKGEIYNEDGALITKVDEAGDEVYSVQAFYDKFVMLKNAKYRLEFDISSTIERPVVYRIQLNKGDYKGYVEGYILLNNQVQSISTDFTMEYDNDTAPRLAFNLGNFPGEEPLPSHTVKIDNVRLIMLDDTGVEYEEDEPKVEQKIVLNQVGYKTNDIKKVVFKGETEDREFKVISKATNEVVYTGAITGGIYNEAAGEKNSFGDFSSIITPGSYYIETKSLGKSYEFTIDDDVYSSVFKDVVKFFYYQRCGEKLEDEYAGKWAHDSCHTDLARVYGTDIKLDVSGGWHDAGDYGRYIVATSKTVADLLSAYGDNKEAFGDDFDIPESGNGIPDILDEVKYQLEWMLKMQEPVSGGVYHKVTCASFPGYIMPEDEKEELIISPISTTATADFAAVMAMGYEYYKDIDFEFAQKCLEAGEKAWDYLEEVPYGSFKNPEGIVTGEYGDSYDTDERYWAAAQLLKATGNEKYNRAFIKMATNKIESGYDWGNVGMYGNIAYINSNGSDQNISGNIKNNIINQANNIVAAAKNDGYNISNGLNYYWGSNLMVTSNAILLTKAYEIMQNPEYLEYAKEHINYCLGKNSLGKSFVTGHGSDSVQNPHHRPSIAKNAAIPGMLAGGPNCNLEDPFVKNEAEGNPVAKCYIDNIESYSTNEVDIYWNSPLVYAMSKLGMY